MNYAKNYTSEIADYHKHRQLHKQLFNHHYGNATHYRESIIEALSNILEYLNDRKTPFTGISVKQMKEKFKHITISDMDKSGDLKDVLRELKTLYLNDTISFHDPKYMAHLNCPILIPALAAEVIISAVNSSMDTWDQSIGGTLIELKLIEWTLDKAGYSPSEGEGVFSSGGTQSNLMGLLLARDHYIKNNYPVDPKIVGLPEEASKFKLFCSEVSHFSLKKSASLLGLGQNSIISVPVDSNYKMDITALKEAITLQKVMGNIPVAVIGTAGTTDFGSIDPLTEIAQIVQHHKLWFHVDAAYGGGLLLSDKHRHKLNGIELSDSLSIDYHKTFFQPVSCGAFFVRNKKNMEYIRYHADYLNPREQELDGIPNMVKKSIQTTRRFDALKLWVSLRTVGKKGFEYYIDTIIDLAHNAATLLQENVNFEVLNRPEISAIVFRYKPFVLKRELSLKQCSDLNTYIRKTLFHKGDVVLASTKVKGEVYLKLTLLNPLTTLNDIKEVMALIEKLGFEYLKNPETKQALPEEGSLQEMYEKKLFDIKTVTL